MEKKLYMCPLIEVAKLNLNGTILVGSIDDDTTPPPPLHPGAPERRTEVF